MKKNIWIKIVILLIIIILVMPSLTPAQDLTRFYEIDESIKLKISNNILLQQQINPSSSNEVIIGEKLDPIYYGPGFVEHMDDSIERDLLQRSNLDMNLKNRNSQHGIWVVPSIDACYTPHSGDHYVINKWGDTNMGIAFPTKVDVHGAWFAGQGGGEGVWASCIRVIGYCNSEKTQITDWFKDIDDVPTWFAINLNDVDRIIIEATPVYKGAGWYAMDDLTYTPKIKYEQEQPATIILDFEECYFNQNLNNSNYGGLTWENGTGDFTIQISDDNDNKELSLRKRYSNNPLEDNNVFSPILISEFQGVIRGDAESWSYPPDSCGAAGPNHFVEVVNRNFAVYDKSTGEELINILLGAFLPGSNGDPRVLFDQYSDRWFVIVCDFDTRIYLAVSTSDDPTESWFKCNFVVSQGSDAGKWPDYPTLGVDEVGIYTAAYMIGGGNGMSIFALDKAPLIAEVPSLGDIYAFRELPLEGAIQPVHTFNTSEGEYFVSHASSTEIRLRLLTNLLSNPNLIELGFVTVPSHYAPPDAPANGSTVPLDTVGDRLMNAVFRDGYIWTAHCIDVDGRAASRWYKIDVSNISLDDFGTIKDSVMYYFFPTIMVNAGGDVIMGFSGSNSDQYAAAYYTGRLASDPPGEMAPPVLLKEGEATYNLIDGYGRNRWGDYSLCSLDPVKQTLWTIQEYSHSHNASGENRWGTWIGELDFNRPPETPTKPDGPEELIQYEETTFTTSAIEPEGEDLYYMFDWGDGNVSGWLGPYASGETGEASYSWADPGVLEIKAVAKDINGIQSNWSEPAILTVVENNKPENPTIEGKHFGFGGIEYEFTFVSTDADGHDIYYKVNWDDDIKTDWLGPYNSCEIITLNHSWEKKGTYWIKSWSKDIYNGTSGQALFKINILTNSAKIASVPRNLMFIKILESLINRFPIVNYLLNRFNPVFS